MDGNITETIRPLGRYDAATPWRQELDNQLSHALKDALKRIGLAGASTECALSKMPHSLPITGKTVSIVEDQCSGG